jgi:cytochrome b561
MGAAVASVYGEYFPFLQWFGLHESMTFGVTALILLTAGWALYRPGRACPADPELAKKCAHAHRWNIRFYWGSVLVWCVGFVAAFGYQL